MKKILFSLSLFIILIVSASQALAHKVIVFGWVENGQLHVEASFGSNKKAQNCQITITDKTGNIIHTMQTGTNGEAVTPVIPKMLSDLTITLDAGAGHKGVWLIPEDEVRAGQSALADVEKKTDAQEKMQQLEKEPSVTQIFTGIGLIFGLALVVSLFKKNTKAKMKQDRHDQ